MTISNSDSLSSRKTGDKILEKEDEISLCLSDLVVRKTLVVSVSQKKGGATTLSPGLQFDNFKSRLKSVILRCISWLNGSFLGGNDRGFQKEGVKTYLQTPMSPF